MPAPVADLAVVPVVLIAEDVPAVIAVHLLMESPPPILALAAAVGPIDASVVAET